MVIEAESKHTADVLGHYGDDFCYYSEIHLGEDSKIQGAYMNVDISEFIKDSMSYEKYITDSLNDIEIDIDIWDN